MFLTQKIFDVVVKTKDDSYALALSAFDAAHQLSIAAKENEIRYLKATLEDTRADLAHEKDKADALMDRLLVRDAKVAAVAAAVAPAAIAAAATKDDAAVKSLKEVFSGLNDIGEFHPEKDHRAFEMAGGSAVKRV